MTSPNNPGPGTQSTGSSTASAAFCAACGAALTAGARFCHRCGTPAGQGMPLPVAASASSGSGSAASVLPWGVAFVALLALVAAFAGKNFGSAKGSGIDGSANSLPTASLDGVAPAGAPGTGPAPDIANMSPEERASRLYNRVMEYVEAGKVDSVAVFAPMALAAHDMLEAPTADERYHHGRLAEVAGIAEIAGAQADTILKARPTSLLGLILSGRAARMRGDSTTAHAVDRLFLGALQSELATRNDDYEQHRVEIGRAAAAARRTP